MNLEGYLKDFDPAVAAKTAEILSAWTGQPRTAAPQPLAGPGVTMATVNALRGKALRFHMAGHGFFDIALDVDAAPLSAVRIARRAGEGYYNGLTFHRIAPNFVIQGGSPGANEYMGEPFYMRDEVGLHLRGTVGISTRGRDTGDAQIFVNTVDSPRLDHIYTVFGSVTAGMDVVDGILEGDVIRARRAGCPLNDVVAPAGQPRTKRPVARHRRQAPPRRGRGRPDRVESDPRGAARTRRRCWRRCRTPQGLVYDPQPLGLWSARAAVAADFRRRGIVISADRVALTASTSEAYALLFKLFCDAGDAILVPRPSYPLFEHLTRLESVTAVPYDLEYHGTWRIDLDSVRRAASPRVKALLIVSPNNPTGSFLHRDDLAALSDSGRRPRLADHRRRGVCRLSARPGAGGDVACWRRATC